MSDEVGAELAAVARELRHEVGELVEHDPQQAAEDHHRERDGKNYRYAPIDVQPLELFHQGASRNVISIGQRQRDKHLLRVAEHHHRDHHGQEDAKAVRGLNGAVHVPVSNRNRAWMGGGAFQPHR